MLPTPDEVSARHCRIRLIRNRGSAGSPKNGAGIGSDRQVLTFFGVRNKGSDQTRTDLIPDRIPVRLGIRVFLIRWDRSAAAEPGRSKWGRLLNDRIIPRVTQTSLASRVV